MPLSARARVRRQRSLLTWLGWVCAMVAVEVPTNLELWGIREDCRLHRIDTFVLATVVNNTDGVVTYALPDGMWCAMAPPGGSALPVGTKAWIYRSASGQCGLEQDATNCNEWLVLFNMLFGLLGGGALYLLMQQVSRECLPYPEVPEVHVSSSPSNITLS